jgi:hypothetical protein
MVQIAWHLYDYSGNLISKNDFIIKPEGFTIPSDVSRLHGITTERALQNGSDLETTLNTFNKLNWGMHLNHIEKHSKFGGYEYPQESNGI